MNETLFQMEKRVSVAALSFQRKMWKPRVMTRRAPADMFTVPGAGKDQHLMAALVSIGVESPFFFIE